MPENAKRADGTHHKEHLTGSLAATPPCPERETLDQSTPMGLLPAQKLCVRCGRVTARRVVTVGSPRVGQPWCGGEQVTTDERDEKAAV